MTHRHLAVALLVVSGCSSSPDTPSRTDDDVDSTAGDESHDTPPASPDSPPPTSRVVPADGSGGERISTSAGTEGGVVILWPRVIPPSAGDDLRDEATAVQTRLRGLVERALPGRTLDVRPEPQRACPQTGCVAPAVSAMILQSGGGCVALLLVTRPGRVSTQIVPWVGQVELRAMEAAFRSPPESQVRVTDFLRCQDLVSSLGENDDAMIAAIQTVGE